MIPLRCQLGLNGLNFFSAAMQTAFGPFFTVYLTQQNWSQVEVGIALSVGSLAALVFQLPAGWVVDTIHLKRLSTAIALVLLALGSLIVFEAPSWEPVLTAQVLRGFAGCLITPAIAALTLILCGHAAFSERLGINGRYASLGTAFAAAVLGAFAHYLSDGAVFLVSAALVVPALASIVLLSRTARVSEDDHAAVLHPRKRKQQRLRPWHIFRETPLHIFAVCVVLFHLANAAMLPLALNELTKRGGQTGFVVSAAVIVPQAVAVACSPWAGRLADRLGRRPVLLFGFAAIPLRGLLFVGLPDALPLVVIQALDGVSATVFGLTMPLIAADVTRQSGYLNLAIGSLGLAAGLGATASTTLAGWIADTLGAPVAFLFLAFIGLASVAAVWLAMPETRPTAPLARTSAMLTA